MGVGKLVLRDREDVVMIAPHGDGLLIYKMRYPKEIRKLEDVPLVDEVKPSKEELKLAKSLVDSMSTTLSKIKLENKYSEAVRELIQAKIDGKEIVAIEEDEKEIVDIMTALKQSIEQAKKKPMTKASGSRATGKAKTKAKTKKVKAKAKRKRKSA